MKAVVASILAFVLLLTPTFAASDKLELASSYDVQGQNPNGSRYSGTVAMKVTSDTTFVITWKIGSTTFRGFGMRWDDLLAVSYEGAGFKGVVVYKVDIGTGVMEGKWTAVGEDKVGLERLIPRR